MKEVIQWLTANYEQLGIALLALVSAAELIVRLTPTEKDDSALERVGSVIRSILNKIGVPNSKK